MRRRLFAVLTFALTLAAFSHALPARATDVRDTILPSTAWVVTIDGKQFSAGTGCLIDREQRLFLTCLHVVKNQPEATVYFPMSSRRDGVLTDAKEYLDGGNGIRACVLATDARRDLALLRLDSVPTGAVALKLADREPKPGESVYGIGNSGNDGKPLEQFSLWKKLESKVINVVYSMLLMKDSPAQKSGNSMNAWSVCVDAPFKHGDSGGPLVNSEGNLVGIAYGWTDDKGYAVCVEELHLFLERAHKPLDLTGSWTARFAAKDGQSRFFKLNFLEGGRLEWVSDNKFEGKYELQDNQLTLVVPSLNIQETLPITRRDDASFSFMSSGMAFTITRR